MRISFIPRYTRNAASTRLRCYAIAEAINKHGLGDAEVTDNPSITLEYECIVLQKSVDLKVFELGDCTSPKLIYDLDDVIERQTKAYVNTFADMVTTDTESRAATIRQWFRGPVHVIPDPIDYEEGPPWQVIEPEIEGAVWFGNWPNFESVRPLMLELQRLGWRIGAISDLSPERANMPGLELIPWRLETFSAELRKWRCAVLSHAGADPCKSANKMVAAYYLGVPCITSDSAEYWSLSTEIGTKGCHRMAISGWQRDVVRKILTQPLGMDSRAEIVRHAQSVIYARYRAEVIARRAVEVYDGA